MASSANQLDVHAQARRVSGPVGSNVSLTCLSSVKPVLCLWKTPYGHVYTLSEGVFAESGRIRHKKLPQGSTNDKQCGIEIIGVEERDAGQWECEVGAVTGEDFKTATANINLEIKGRHIVIFRFMYKYSSDLFEYPLVNIYCILMLKLMYSTIRISFFLQVCFAKKCTIFHNNVARIIVHLRIACEKYAIYQISIYLVSESNTI